MTVSGGRRRADLVLPTAVPVAELLPDLAGRLDLLDGATAHEPLDLTTVLGDRLGDDLGLGPQGVADGALLLLTAGPPAAPPARHDDPADAVAEAVERTQPPWSPAAARRTTLAAAVLALGLGLAALSGVPAGSAATVAGVLGSLLVVLAVVGERRHGDRATVLVLTWLASCHGAVTGALLAPMWRAEATLAAAGAGLLVVALGCVALRLPAVPPALVGCVAVVAGVLVLAGVDRATAAPIGLVVLVLAGNATPRLASGAAGLHADTREEHARALEPRVTTGHDLLLAAEVALGVAVVALAPVVGRLGPWGTALAATGAVAVLLRAVHRRSAPQVQVVVTAGVAALVALGAVLLVTGSAGPGPALVAPVVGLAALAGLVLGVRPTVRLRRWGAVLETLAVVALLPLLVLTVGWFDAIRG
ncbi:type VII secretion integral membrane protein EccD [Nocardioides panacisoli]|uniref:type VII secretion integral membrane protein EccD n=1 Tax=Nocardioides panacisoli TaxID=627624 RepID=UPI001C634A3E|nr:type VII secretion integral membrane protein EccD [Nocardioides panacisoli]QYJ03667.1 type VII secretion integral membrane protein EccD [Nocardioides panacisoli]